MSTPLLDELLTAPRLTAPPFVEHGLPWLGSAVVYGPAVSQGSKRLGRAHGSGKPMLLDADPRLKHWRSQMQTEMLKKAPPAPLDAPIWVRITVDVPRPRSHYGTGKNAGLLKSNAPEYPVSGRDLDKVARAVLDAGTGIFWRDDSRVIRLEVSRSYFEQERVSVLAWAMKPAKPLREVVLPCGRPAGEEDTCDGS